MSKPIDPKMLGSIFHKVWADYDATRQSRFIRKRTGVAPQGGSEDYNFRTEIKYYELIEQARDMDRNDGLVGTLADRRVDNIVQQGFTLDTKTGDKKLDQDLWQRWQAYANDPEQCDIAGELCWHEIERLVCRAESIDGDIVVVGTEEGAFQTIEAHAIQTSTRIDHTFLGVTRDIYGRREQYHVRYDLNEFGQKSESIPIDVRDEYGVRQLFHIYNPKRVSGTRGVTQLAPVFALSGMLEDINFAKLVQQQIVSCFAILRSRAPGAGSSLPSTTSLYGEPGTETTRTGSRVLEGISPGMEIDAEEGESLSGFSPNVPNSEYFQQVRLIMQLVGVNFGLPLCLVLMDGSESSFSGWRGAVDEARKGFVADQMNLVRRLHMPAYTWWLSRELGMDSSLRKVAKRDGIKIFGHNWQMPTWSYIEPVADAEGDTAQLRNALTSPRRMHAARGKDWETIAEEIIDDNVYAISAAQSKANEVNKKFPDAPPLSWRDLIPLPMPEGQTLAMQDPNAIAAQEEEAEKPAPKPAGRLKKNTKKKPRAEEFDESKVKRADDGKFGSGGGGGGSKTKKETPAEKFEKLMQSKAPADAAAFRQAKSDGVSIPPAWTEVQYYGADKDIIAEGRDSKGRKQRSENPAYRQRISDENNARIAQELMPRISELRTQLKADAASGDEESKVLYLITQSGFRIGGAGDGKAKTKAYGASTLEGQHAKVDGDTVTFDFPGKKGVRQQHTITDSVIADMVRDKQPGEKIFSTRDTKVRDAWKSKYGGTKVHDIRHVVATEMAQAEIAARIPPQPKTDKDKTKLIKEIAKVSGAKLGNNPAQALGTYIDPGIWKAISIG